MSMGMGLLRLFLNPTTLLVIAALGVLGYVRHDAKMDERARSQIVCDGRIKSINEKIQVQNDKILAEAEQRRKEIEKLLEERIAEGVNDAVQEAELRKRIEEYEAQLEDVAACTLTDDDINRMP